MKRYLNLGVFIVIGLIILALAFWPAYPIEPTTVSADAIKPGQESFAIALNSGILYEKNDLPDLAKSEYQKAASAAQLEIVNAANTNLQRLALQQKDFIYTLRLTTKAALQMLAQLVIYLVAAVLVILFLWQLILLFPVRKGYLLQPFEDLTPDSNGKHFHTQIARQLTQIRQIQFQAKDQLFNSLERLDFPLVSPEWNLPADVLTLLDATKIGQINLPLSGALQAINKWLNRRTYSIEGDIEPSGKAFSIHVQITQTADHSQVFSWDLTTSGEGGPAEQMHAAAEEAAYRLVYYLCQQQVQAHSWRSLQLFIQGLQQMQQGQDAGIHPDLLEKSVDSLNKCIQIDPGYPLALFAQGMDQIYLGKYTLAQGIFSRLIKWHDQDESLRLAAQYNLGLAYYHMYRKWGYDKAVAAFMEVISQFNKTTPRDEWSKALWALAYCGLISVEAQRLKPLLQEKPAMDFAKAKSQIETYIASALSLGGNRKDVHAVIHFSRGILNMAESGANEAALNEFMESLKIRPDYIECYIYLAILKFDMDDKNEAIRLLKQTEELRLPGNEYAMYRLGDIYEKLNEIEGAQNSYFLAQNIPEARFALGNIYARQNDRFEALEQFRAATALNSKNPEYWDSIAWTIINPSLLDKDLLKEAFSAADRMLQLVKNTSKEWRVRELIGWIAFIQGDQTRAIHELSISIRLSEHRQNYYHLACVFFAADNLKKARENAIKSLQITDETGTEWKDGAIELLRKIEKAQPEEEEKDLEKE